MKRHQYDERFDPPAPVLVARVGAPGVPPHVAVPALVDTGADLSVVGADLARVLDLPVVGTVRIQTVTGEGNALLYAMSVAIEDDVVDVRVVSAGDEVLVGRDVLGRLILTLDGPAGELEIST